MGKSYANSFLFFTICIWSSLNFADGRGIVKRNKFIVIGHVYCDTCRVEFETKISQPIVGAIVNLECRNRTDGSPTYKSPKIVTGSSGAYIIEVVGNYVDSDCEVGLVRSPRADCNEMTKEWRKARVVLTGVGTLSGNIRYANNLGFKKKKALPECKKVLKKMGYYELRKELGDEAVA